MLAQIPPGRRARLGFSLVELMIVVLIVSILATLVIGAYTGSMQLGKVARTRAQMAKIDSLLAPIWESYGTRRIDTRELDDSDLTGNDALKKTARARLAILRQLQRYELPDRLSDLRGWNALSPDKKKKLPPRTQLYLKMAALMAPQWMSPSSPDGNKLSLLHQHSECLYLILANTQDSNTNGLEFFHESEIEDTDGDGMPEILDGWGNPIEFLRWAPGFESDKQKFKNEEGGWNEGWIEENPDPLDPLGVDTEAGGGGVNDGKKTYYLHPLVFSAGPDGKYHIATDIRDMEDDSDTGGVLNYDSVHNNPYAVFSQVKLGEHFEDRYGYVDNIHNHFLRVRAQ